MAAPRPSRDLRPAGRPPGSVPVPAARTPEGGDGAPRPRFAGAVVRSVVARAVTLPVTAVTNLALAHTVVGAVGVPGYAQFALVTTLPAVLPLTDLGAGAAITEAVARDTSPERRLVRGAVLAAARNLMCAGAVVAVLGVTLALFGMWDTLLGRGAQQGSDATVALAAVLFGCSMPLGLSRSVLLAVNRNDVAFLLQGAGSALLFALVLGAARLGAPTGAFVAVAFASQCLVSAAGGVLAGRYLGMPLLGMTMGSVRASAVRDRTPIAHLALPMAVVTAATAVAYATDRLVLSHTADASAVAGYSAGAQFFAPASSLLGAAGLPLWALFARRRRSPGTPRRQLVAFTAWFAAGGLAVGAGITVLGPLAGTWMMHERIRVGTGLMAAFAALLFVQAVAYPSTMWATDAAGLRFQAVVCSLMAAVNLAVSIPLARLGAAGPVIGSVASYAVFVLVPTLFRAFRRPASAPPARRRHRVSPQRSSS
ncbi:lipopolysaccharide biosynthesis protein [Streptomyces sp. NPDC052040]|uniref:lipopolysaccharide biosynthesis protein n=1 Tax=unclassified Streptomyces TaxID=2593676 RepID=UPI0037D93F40